MSTVTMRPSSIGWQAAKPKVIYFAIGLMAGPLIANFADLQVLSGTARGEARAGIVELQAKICAAQARKDISDPGRLSWTARDELALKWAVMPGATTVEAGVARACALKLAN